MPVNIRWSHPPLPERVHAHYKSVQPQTGIDPTTVSMRGNHLAYAATQGKNASQYVLSIPLWQKFIDRTGNVASINKLCDYSNDICVFRNVDQGGNVGPSHR